MSRTFNPETPDVAEFSSALKSSKVDTIVTELRARLKAVRREGPVRAPIERKEMAAGPVAEDREERPVRIMTEHSSTRPARRLRTAR